jgi:S1-C subfamily serine protease
MYNRNLTSLSRSARFVFIAFVTLFTLVVTSCRSDKNVVEVPDYASGIQNIKHNLDNSRIDLFEAYMQTLHWKENIAESDQEIDKADMFADGLYEQMQTALQTSLDNEEYMEAVAYAKSLDVLGKVPATSLEEVFTRYIAKADLSSDIFTRLQLKEEMAELGFMPDKMQYDLMTWFSDNRSRGEYLYHFNRIEETRPDLLKKYPDLKSRYDEMVNLSDLNIEELRKAVVTVILDKGMNIRSGMGYYDKSIGTGFFIDDKGYILTNHHVIADHVDPEYEGYTKVYVSMFDDPDTEIPAQVVGFDKVFDIALLQVARPNKHFLTLGRSGDVKVGDRIYSIGNPLGLKYSVSSGIISNKDFGLYFQLGKGFQVDAAINPGNSGGPLIDEKGQVIGIVFAGVPEYEGINFAIPFQWVKKTIPELYRGGEVKRCWIGSGIYQADSKTLEFYYLLPNGPADQAGIKKGDLLRTIDGYTVSTLEEAQSRLAWMRYPRLVQIGVERDGELLYKVARLESRPYLPVEEVFARDTQSNIITLIYGVDLDYYDKSVRQRKYKTEKVYKGMWGYEVGFGAGDPITVYDLKYIEKDMAIYLTCRYRQKETGLIDRVVTIPAYVEINTIL